GSKIAAARLRVVPLHADQARGEAGTDPAAVGDAAGDGSGALEDAALDGQRPANVAAIQDGVAGRLGVTAADVQRAGLYIDRAAIANRQLKCSGTGAVRLDAAVVVDVAERAGVGGAEEVVVEHVEGAVGGVDEAAAAGEDDAGVGGGGGPVVGQDGVHLR